ncbi:hybrid cluster protein-associated redox disulfide domain-containing protein [Peptoclostridium litorale DSM 5388]|uniref:DUF1858 domain-containing protein n=1 Tax=Peptoclostridium litorale DSM 5388 TaxID=1121324 RepID=A0A069RJN3_PEPLI|nr:DUF1858 domain-containing protein [Peptoclostridium litorale]KDR96355.1 hypothetical protein CLIT_4c01930 [Peptoclostridium litorale DSM 5388]SIO26888.1 hybrid cluster protein-associated redox disulfide domain-containing protein [Peptoclostridium litorale DSM 5388]
MFKVTKDMTITDILAEDRNTAYIFMKYGMHCLGCPSARFETVEQAAQVHGLDLEKLIEELEKFFEEKNKDEK